MAKTTTNLKIVVMLYYLAAALNVLGGLIMLIGGGLMGNMLKSMGGLAGIIGGLMVVGAIIIIGLGVLDYFIAKGLTGLKKWAYTVAIIFSILGIISGLITISGGAGIIGIIINGYIAYTLLIDKETKALFQ